MLLVMRVVSRFLLMMGFSHTQTYIHTSTKQIDVYKTRLCFSRPSQAISNVALAPLIGSKDINQSHNSDTLKY